MLKTPVQLTDSFISGQYYEVYFDFDFFTTLSSSRKQEATDKIVAEYKAKGFVKVQPFIYSKYCYIIAQYSPVETSGKLAIPVVLLVEVLVTAIVGILALFAVRAVLREINKMGDNPVAQGGIIVLIIIGIIFLIKVWRQ